MDEKNTEAATGSSSSSLGMRRAPRHDKRRSALIVYDQLVNFASQRLVAGDDSGAMVALSIVREHFCQGSELLKELRVMNALVNGGVSSRDIAASVIREARLAVQRHDAARLEREKTALSGDIVARLGGQSFFDTRVPEYKAFATAQVLVNDWRRPSELNMVRTAEYEDAIIDRLVEHREPVVEQFPGADGLVVRMMTKKLNERYGGLLTPAQRRLIKEFIAAPDPGAVACLLKDVRRRAASALEIAKNGVLEESSSVAKATDVAALLAAEQDNDMGPECFARHMLYARLIDEIIDAEDKKTR